MHDYKYNEDSLRQIMNLREYIEQFKCFRKYKIKCESESELKKIIFDFVKQLGNLFELEKMGKEETGQQFDKTETLWMSTLEADSILHDDLPADLVSDYIITGERDILFKTDEELVYIRNTEEEGVAVVRLEEFENELFKHKSTRHSFYKTAKNFYRLYKDYYDKIKIKPGSSIDNYRFYCDYNKEQKEQEDD